MEVRFQEPEPLFDAARDVGVDRRTARILDISGVRNAGSQRRGIKREALRQRQ
jgi:hypothetical protein